jgi:hypothetical protein
MYLISFYLAKNNMLASMDAKQSSIICTLKRHCCMLPYAKTHKHVLMHARKHIHTHTHTQPQHTHTRTPQGCKATICMPVNTPGIKVESVRKLGGTVELVGESYQETQVCACVCCVCVFVLCVCVRACVCV